MSNDRELLNGFFCWLVDQGIAKEGYVPDKLSTSYLLHTKAKKPCQHCQEMQPSTGFIWVTIAGEEHLFCGLCAAAFKDGTLYYGALSTRSPQTKSQAEQNRARDNLVKVSRANSGFPEARQ